MGDKGRGGRANLASSSALAVWAMAHRNAAASGRRRDTPNERHTTDRHRGVAAAAAAAVEVCDGVRGRNDTAVYRRGDDPSSVIVIGIQSAKGGDDDDATTSTGVVRDPAGGVETHHRVRVSFAEGRRNCGLSHLFVGSATGGKANVMGMVTGMVSVMGM